MCEKQRPYPFKKTSVYRASEIPIPPIDGANFEKLRAEVEATQAAFLEARKVFKDAKLSQIQAHKAYVKAKQFYEAFVETPRVEADDIDEDY